MNDQRSPRSSVAVLMTCHNRRDLTLRCLGSLAVQEAVDADLTVYLVDDASGDDTTLAVQAEFPAVRVLAGTGQLFWSGGMRLAQQAALPSDPDYLLWLNDDVCLGVDAVASLLATHRSLCSRGTPDAIVVGAMKDPDTGVTTYSGVVRRDRIRRMRFTIVEPTHEPAPCETMNGNLVLVPRSVYRRVGLFDSSFAHAMNDFDYGLRARSNACKVWIAPGHLGTCMFNSTNRPGLDDTFPFRERVRYLLSPKGLPPREWLRFTRRHGGVFWPGLFIAPYVRFLGRAAVSLRPTERADHR
jgi:GT2 family glycosyltransferase